MYMLYQYITMYASTLVCIGHTVRGVRILIEY